MRRIDAHLHVAEVIAGYCRRGELRAAGNGKAMWGNGEVFDLLPKGWGDRNFTAESALSLMEKHGVERAVLMQGSMYGFQNQYHAGINRMYPEKFCASCTVDPFMTEALDMMNYFYEELGFHLTKFEVSSGGGLMGCHEPFSLTSDKMMQIYDVINRHRGVLALDVGDYTMPSHQPERLAVIAKSFPDLKLVVCHLLAPVAGETGRLLHSLELLNQDNVWFDLAALPKILAPCSYPFHAVHTVLSEAKQIIGSDRMMWGTDAPFAATQNPYGQLTDYLEQGNTFTEEELEKVYYKNAYQVYFCRE